LRRDILPSVRDQPNGARSQDARSDSSSDAQVKSESKSETVQHDLIFLKKTNKFLCFCFCIFFFWFSALDDFLRTDRDLLPNSFKNESERHSLSARTTAIM
jgi:hypothetical protein